MIASIISLLGGGLLRAIPELLGLWGKKTDNDHELAMLKAQTELERLTAADKLATTQAQGVVDTVVAAMAAQTEALKGQMQPLVIPLTGIKWLDAIDALISTVTNALNMLVRPLTTYYFLAIYGTYKAALLAQALQTHDAWAAIILVYTADDQQMLAGVMGFWFMGRVFDKQK
jgi:hypothetical protein